MPEAYSSSKAVLATTSAMSTRQRRAYATRVTSQDLYKAESEVIVPCESLREMWMAQAANVAQARALTGAATADAHLPREPEVQSSKRRAA